MGYGEVQGGGSVIWRIQHGDKAEKGKGIDPDPHDESGTFTVVVDGEVVSKVPIRKSKIFVIWSPDDETTVPGLRADTQVQPGD
jgi:hypothetical protein